MAGMVQRQTRTPVRCCCTTEKGYLVRKPKYYVRIKDSPGHWSAGRSRAEAIGELIRTHGEAFGIKVSDLGVLAR